MSGLVISQQSQTVRQANQLQSLSHFSSRISDLVHELQKERGMSALFIGSRGQQMGAELEAQRRDTDGQTAIVREALRSLALSEFSAELRQSVEKGLSGLSELEAKRGDISGLKIVGPESFRFYTALITNLLAVPQESVKVSDSPAVTANLLAYFICSPISTSWPPRNVPGRKEQPVQPALRRASSRRRNTVSC